MNYYRSAKVVAPTVAALASITAHYYYYQQRAEGLYPSTTVARLEQAAPPPPKPAVATSKDPLERWQKRWDANRIMWHQDQVYWALNKYGPDLWTPQSRVLVPLCGKTVDLAYLATQVETVVGVEGIPKALEQFMAEHPGLDWNKQPESSNNDFDVYRGSHSLLVCGNFFQFGPHVAGRYDLIWDRAAMVAIDPSKREEYVAVLGSVLQPNSGVLLLSALIRPGGDVTSGPPFTINDEQVRALFEGQPWVASVECINTDGEGFRNEPWLKRLLTFWRFKGSMKEHIWVIRAK